MTPADTQDLNATGAGDRAALERLVALHGASVLRLTRALTPNDAMAEDAAQDAWLLIWRHADQWRGDGSARSWVLRIARRAAARARRRKAGEPLHFDPLEPMSSEHSGRDAPSLLTLGVAAGWGTPQPTPERLASDAERRALLRRALGCLDEQDRTVLHLRDIEGLSGHEAAQAMGLPVGALKSRLHRARLRLMAQLRTMNPSGGPQ